ncbi:Sister chromatid cohesion protein 2 [Ceratobasidium sp. 370]|nr:Sister chromatid cohesion protein 2 [Ceratobasidium sp. 370]
MDSRNMTPLVASASTPDPQALMAAYPFASATPSAHVSRHLSSLSSASSVPSFISHGQQQYQDDPQARQYAARALEAEVRQQGVYQGYAPPTRWAPSDYTAPADPYAQYSYGSGQSYGYAAPQQQQSQYPQNAQVSDLHGRDQSSQYPYSSQQYSSSASYPHENQASVQRPTSQHQHQASSHLQSNLKPQSQSYSQQPYPTPSSRTLAPSSSDPTGGRNPYHHSYGTHHQQRSQPVHSSPAYGSQPTTSSYPSQAPTASSYSQPVSSATSYPTQPNSHTRSAPSDSISSSFLAPLASHQFAPRLSQPVSTLPRHNSDAQVRYSTSGERSYSTDSSGYSAGAGSSSGRSYPANLGSSYGTVPSARGSNSVHRSVSQGQYQRPSAERGPESGYAPESGKASGGYAEQVRANGRSGHPAQQPGQPQATYANQTWGAEQHRRQNQAHGGYHGQSRSEQSNQRAGGHQNYVSGDQANLLGGQASLSGGYQVQSPGGLGASNFFQQQAQTRQTQPDQGYAQAPKNSYAQSERVLQRPSQDSYARQGQDQYTQPGRTYPQSQPQAWQTQAQDFSRAPQQQQEPRPQSAASVGRHVQSVSVAQQLQSSYTGTPQDQVQAPAQAQPHSAQPRVEQQTQVHLSNSPQTQFAHPQDQPSSRTYSQSSHAQLQPQPGQPEPQPLSQLPPPPAQTQAQIQHRGIYAPLAGRTIRGRGGRQLHNGPQRVLQGGPPRILTPPQPPQSQAQETQRWAQNAPIRQMQQTRPGQQPMEPQPRPVETTMNRQELGGDTTMEYAGPTQPASTDEYNSVVPDAGATYPDSPPPPYEPLMRERVKRPQDEAGQGQEVNGYAAQLQQLSLRSQPSTPQPPAIPNVQQLSQIQPLAQQAQPVRPSQQEPSRKHTVEDSAAHFEAFLSATVPAKPKPSSSTQPAPAKTSAAPQRPPLPLKASSSGSTSSSTARPRMTPVVELPRTGFMTPRKDKKWREPRREIATDSPPRRDVSSPDSLGLSPMKRKRDSEVEPGTRTVKRMMSMSIESVRTPSSSLMHDATMRTPGSSTRTPGKYASLPSSKMRFVIEMPPPRKTTNGSSSDLVMKSPNRSNAGGMSTVKRDVHLEKLCALIEEVIEAEDTLDPEAAAENGGPAEWFSAHTSDWSAPLLAPTIISRLTQLAARRGARLSEVDTGNLTRILKMLGRSVAKGEDLDPFGSLLGGAGAGNATKAKIKAKKKGKGAAEEEVEEEEPKEEVELGEDDFLKLASVLETAKEAVVAAGCVFAILSAEKLPKQLYSEDLITSCLAAVKNQLSSIIYPYVETASDVHGHSPPLLLHVAQSTSSSAMDHRNLLGEIFRALNAVLPRITTLANHGISETMVIQAAFIGIGPFFVVEVASEKGSKASAADKKNGGRIQVLDALGGSTSMRGLRLTALGLVRALFASYESQRAWIVEEILGSLIKLPDMKLKAGQFKLRDGATIHVVSALLFQLVQTSAHDVRIHAQRLARKRREAIADANASITVENGKPPLLDEHDREEMHLYLNGLESATKTAKTIVLFLTQRYVLRTRHTVVYLMVEHRTGKNKNTKSSNEAEYRSIFDNLIQDILVVINWPEWPAANLLMGIVCKFMLSSLEDVKSSSDSAAKNMALDHLGEIATRLRETHLTLQRPFETTVKPLDEIVASCDLKALDDLITAHSDVYAHLSKRSSDDQAYDSARELTAAAWAQELATCLRQCDSILSKVEEDEDMEGSNEANLPELANRIKAALRNAWKEGAHDMFEAGTDAEVKRVDDLAERFAGTQSLRNAFEPILGAILMSLDAPAVFMRTKALRALGLIVTKDSSILKQSNVRRAIESHLMDSSPAVRDAAVELIGKYLVLSPELVDDYYPQIANRIADTGLAVRKRVIKLLKSLYSLTDDVARRVDICTKLVLRMLDEDDGIKDLSISSIEELWFSDGNEANTGRRGTARENHGNGSAYMTNKISVIMGVNANFRDRHSPLEDMLHEIIARKGDKDAGSIVQRYIDVCDALTDTLVDAQEIPGFSVVNCIRTVHVFTAAHPTVMSTRKAVVLLPYLKSGATADDQAIADYLLKIFRSCIPRMPAGTSKFGTELQQTLEPMVIKPSGAAGVAALPETVACLCAVVHHITHDYQRLVALLRSCNARLVQVLAKQNQPNAQEIATLSILALIVSLLGEHSDFDKIREEQPTLKPSIDAIKQTSIAEYIYGLIHQLYRRFNDQLLRGRLLQCFGFLFRAHPSLLTRDDSAEMMDAIFASPQEEAQARLLKIMQDFLLSEASKHTHAANHKPKKGGAVNMDELIGNTDGFADSGVSSAIIQRYLTQILSSALSPNRYIQTPAVDILSFTVRQGLAHPLQCFPIIVALETSHDNSLSSRASNLHTLLHNKHASLLNSRYLESVGRSLEYQKQLQPGSWKGYRLSPHPTALLHRWYSLVREKRQPKLDFLKSFLRAFDVDVAVLSCSQDHLDLVRYIAENVSSFDYKTQEEILTVIRHLTHVLSVAGMHIVEILSQEQRAREASGTAMEVDGAATTPTSSNRLSRARVSTTISIILVLKAHLKHLYGITEEKASRWVPGKKSAVGDKPAVARHDKPIAWERVPFATRAGKTAEDVRAQEEQLLELWAEDGVTAEPDEFGE